ncbi:hypothetical protein RCL1_000063 [Eukaryota sp. TZLM3-RCL]
MRSFLSKFVSSSSFSYKIADTYFSSSFWKVSNCQSFDGQHYSALNVDNAESGKCLLKYRHPYLLSVIDATNVKNTSYTIVTPQFIPLSIFLTESRLPSNIPLFDLYSALSTSFHHKLSIFPLLIRHAFDALSFAHSNGFAIFSECKNGIEAADLFCLYPSGQFVLSAVNFKNSDSNFNDLVAKDYSMFAEVIKIFVQQFQGIPREIANVAFAMKKSNGDITAFGAQVEDLSTIEFDLFDRLMTLPVIAPRGRSVLMGEVDKSLSLFPSFFLGLTIIPLILSAVLCPSLNDTDEDSANSTEEHVRGDRSDMMTFVFDLVDVIKSRNDVIVVDRVVNHHLIPTITQLISTEHSDSKVAAGCHSASLIASFLTPSDTLSFNQNVVLSICQIISSTLKPYSFKSQIVAAKALISIAISEILDQSIVKSELNKVITKLINEKDNSLKSLGLVLGSKSLTFLDSKVVNLLVTCISKISLDQAPSFVLSSICVLSQSLAQSNLIDGVVIVNLLIPTVSKLTLCDSLNIAKSAINAVKSLVVRLERDLKVKIGENSSEVSTEKSSVKQSPDPLPSSSSEVSNTSPIDREDVEKKEEKVEKIRSNSLKIQSKMIESSHVLSGKTASPDMKTKNLRRNFSTISFSSSEASPISSDDVIKPKEEIIQSNSDIQPVIDTSFDPPIKSQQDSFDWDHDDDASNSRRVTLKPSSKRKSKGLGAVRL